MRATLVLGFVLLAMPSPATSAPIAVAAGDGAIVTLTDEPCALKTVTNLPLKATWVKDGKTWQGCYGSDSGMVATYWEDYTIVMIPARAFRRSTGI